LQPYASLALHRILPLLEDLLLSTMMDSLKKMKNGLVGSSAKFENAEADIMEEETGTWHYLVVDPAGMRPREDASYSKDTKQKDLDRVKEGTVVQVDARRKASWMKWLRMKHGGSWLFDVSPKDKKVRMVEVEVICCPLASKESTGEWQYQVIGEVAVLQKPSMSAAAAKPKKGAAVLANGELVGVRERVRPLNGKGSFLRLSDGRGWVLDFANGRQAMQRCKDGGDNGGIHDGAGVGSCDQMADTIVDIAPKELGEPELGSWDYIVLDAKGIALRSGPDYDKNTKLQQRLEEGELVHVTERRAGNGTTFLHLDSPQGWAFDLQPGEKNKRQRLAEVQMESGTWFYRVVAPKGIALRSRCTFSLDSKVGQGPNEGSVVPISRRVKVGKTMFLKPRDENGWIFDAKNGKVMVEGPMDVEVPTDVTACLNIDKEFLLSAPTSLPWAVTKKLILKGSRMQVALICNIQNPDGSRRRWAHLTQSAGSMDGWVPYDMLDVDRSQGSKQTQASVKPMTASFDAKSVRAALDAPTARWGS